MPKLKPHQVYLKMYTLVKYILFHWGHHSIHIAGTIVLLRINVDCVFLASYNNRHNHIHNNRKWLKLPQSRFHEEILHWKQPFFCVFMYSLYGHSKFRSQAKMSTIRPAFPDYLSVSYDYDSTYHDHLLNLCKLIAGHSLSNTWGSGITELKNRVNSNCDVIANFL